MEQIIPHSLENIIWNCEQKMSITLGFMAILQLQVKCSLAWQESFI
jgi:hypothetical protein